MDASLCANAATVTAGHKGPSGGPLCSEESTKGTHLKMIKTFLAALCGAVAVAAPFQAVNAYPLFAQWGGYGLSPSQQNFQRGNGWSSGDYFGPRLMPSRPQVSSPSSYQPGLQHNLRYRSNSCSQFVSC